MGIIVKEYFSKLSVSVKFSNYPNNTSWAFKSYLSRIVVDINCENKNMQIINRWLSHSYLVFSDEN